MSDNYLVSARKYRPLTFDTVVGQEHITTTLKNAIKHKQLAHAFLFCGPRGVGKTTCARILAKTINCEHPTEDMEACGECNACIGFKNNSLFNVFELDAASNNSVDDIRELTNQVRFAPQQGKYKVYIIDEVHMLSASAFNAFLKTLEEPPPYAIFILATTEKHKILPTILSRCQIFDFKRITTNDIVRHLQGISAKEGMTAEEAALHVIAQKSEGCMRDALSMLDRISSFTGGALTYINTMEHLNLLDADFYFRLTDRLLCKDMPGTLLLLDKALERGFEGDNIINGLAEHFRNLLLCKDARMAKLLDVPNDHKLAFYEKANQTPPSYLISALSIINESELEYKNATNKRLHVEMCLIRLCYLMDLIDPTTKEDLSFIGSGNSGEEKKNFNNAVTTPAPTEVTSSSVANFDGYERKREIDSPGNGMTTVVGEPDVRYNTLMAAKRVEPELQSPRVSKAFSAKEGENNPPVTRRISRSMFTDLDDITNNPAAGIEIVKKELNQVVIEELYKRYLQYLKEDNKPLVYTQFCMTKIEWLPPDEMRIISPNVLIDTYAKEERNRLIDYFKAETNVQVRITTMIVEKELSATDRPLNRTEMFEEMSRVNANLILLKESLNLQLEY